MLTLIMTLFCMTASAQDVPYFPRSTSADQDMGGMNQNFRDLSDSKRSRLTQNVSASVCASGQFLACSSSNKGIMGGCACNFISTNSIVGAYVSRVGDTMTGALTMSGAASSIVSGTSITASAFFGYGGNLTGIPAETNTYTSSKTLNAGLYVVGATTSSYFYGNGSGLTSIGSNVFASITDIPAVSGTNSTFLDCVAGSTLTYTTTASDTNLDFSLSMTAYNNNATATWCSTIFVDGANVFGGVSQGMCTQNVTANQKTIVSFHWPYALPSAGTHNACISIRSSAGTTVIDGDANYGNVLSVVGVR